MARVIFVDEQGQNLNRYQLVPVDGQPNVYDLVRLANITQQGTPYSKEVGDHFLQVEDGVPVQTLASIKSGTVYALTGLTATAGKVPVLFAVDTAYVAGDTVTINGTAYTIKTTDGTALTAGAWAVGAIITGTVDVDAKTLTVGPSAPVGARPATWLPTKSDLGLGNVNNTADASKSVNYAASAGYAGSAGSATNATNATYSTHAVGSGSAALRNITPSASQPSGGSDGDVWLVG